MVELYLSSELSFRELATQERINNPAILVKWVNDFRIAGPDALRPKKKDRKRSLNSKKQTKAVLSFPKSTYMYWQKRFDRVNPNKEIEDRIIAIHREHKDFGYRRVLAVLRREGRTINKKKVQRIMQKHGLQVTSYTRKNRKYSSYKGKVGRIAPNRIHRRFHTTIPHQKITTDTTEFKYYEIDEKGRMAIKKLYLDPFLDMFNGEILSYGISETPSAASILSAKGKRLKLHQIARTEELFIPIEDGLIRCMPMPER